MSVKCVDGRKMCVGGGRIESDGREESVLEFEKENCVGVRFNGEISGIVGSKVAFLEAEERRAARGGIGGGGGAGKE